MNLCEDMVRSEMVGRTFNLEQHTNRRKRSNEDIEEQAHLDETLKEEVNRERNCDISRLSL